MNKTKVIASIGPASQDEATLKALMMNGIDAVRINMSHADFAFCDDIVRKVQTLNQTLKKNVAIMVDIPGPTVRIDRVKDGCVTFKAGTTVCIHMKEITGDHTKISVNYPGLASDVKCHSIIKIDDGKIILEVIDKEPEMLICNVIQGGLVRDHKSLNVPGVPLNIPFLRDYDRQIITYAHQNHLDFLALSFVRSSEDILEVNDLLIELGNDHLGIVAKIENEQAIEDIDQIIKASDAVMVVRGDLGVEIPFERLPGLQKMILRKCHIAGVVSIVATEILSSMEDEMIPTRAEVSDLANAVLDGVDAVMLSGETTTGKYPVETTMMMERIIASSEEDINYYEFVETSMRTEKQDITGNIAYSVTDCANRLKCIAIVAPTVTGYTARKISRFRSSCPIIALCPDPETARSLALHFAVQPVHVKKLDQLDKMIHVAKECVKTYIERNEGHYILTGGYPFEGVKHTNFMRIEKL